MREIELSIIIPIYNVEKYLRKCLDSIYGVKIEKEVILINDGSQDRSFQIMEEYKKQFPEETVIISQENKGVSAARNQGLEIARGKYIYFMDSDDFIDAKEYEKFFEQVRGSDIEIIHGNGVYYRQGKKEEVILEVKDSRMSGTISSGKELYDRFHNLEIYRDYVWLNIYRKDYLLKNSFHFDEGITYEDKVFSQKAFWKAEKIKYLPIPFYFYRQHSESIVHKLVNVLDYFYVHNCMLDFALQENITNFFVTKEIICIIRSLAKKEKVFNEEIYRKLWKLPKKNFLCYRNLVDLYFRKRKLKQIPYQEIVAKGHKKRNI